MVLTFPVYVFDIVILSSGSSCFSVFNGIKVRLLYTKQADLFIICETVNTVQTKIFNGLLGQSLVLKIATVFKKHGFGLEIFFSLIISVFFAN